MFTILYMKTANISIIIVLIIVAVAVAAYFYFQRSGAPDQVDEGSVVEELNIPAPVENPGQELPDINPASKANPFENVYQNPFE